MKHAVLSLLIGCAICGPVQADKTPDAPTAPRADEVREALRVAREDRLEAVREQLSAAREQLRKAAAKVIELNGELGSNRFTVHTSMPGQGYLGLVMIRGDGKLTVKSVVPGSPADDAGIRAGAAIVAVEGQPVGESDTHTPLPAGLMGLDPGDEVTLTLVKGDETREVTVTAAEGDTARWLTAVSGVEGTEFYLENLEIPDVKVVTLDKLEQLPSFVRSIVRLRPHSPFTWPELELVGLSPELGSYFGTDDGILVVNVPDDGKLGLQPGDVILRIGGREPNNPAHAFRILRSYGKGETIKVSILRHGEERTLTHTLDKAE